MQSIYTIFIFAIAMILSTGCGLAGKLEDLIPTPAPAQSSAPEEADRGEAISGIEEELAEESAPTPTPTPAPEETCDPETQPCFSVTITKCLMSKETEEDSGVRFVGTLRIITYSNGQVRLQARFNLKRGSVYLNISAEEEDQWYATVEDAADADYLYERLATDARHGFQLWADLTGAGSLYFSDGTYSANATWPNAMCERLQ